MQLVASNQTIEVPPGTHRFIPWKRVIDTNLASPDDIAEPATKWESIGPRMLCSPGRSWF